MAQSIEQLLTSHEASAVRYLVWRTLDEVPAQLVEAALFGSRARDEGRPDSDVDILLVFEQLPDDREPHATLAERIAAEIESEVGVPLGVWCVALADLAEGERTPMLVDALTDAVPVWCWPEPLSPVSFTPADALRCTRSLLDRVGVGSSEFADYLRRGDEVAAARRGRDDLLKLATALLLLQGITRPRRAEVIEALLDTEFASSSAPPSVRLIFDWVRLSFGPSGQHESLPLTPPPGGVVALARSVDLLRGRIRRAVTRLAA